MSGILMLIVMTTVCLLTYLISYIFMGISLILFGITVMGMFFVQNDFILLFIVLLIMGLLVLRISKLKINNNIDF